MSIQKNQLLLQVHALLNLMKSWKRLRGDESTCKEFSFDYVFKASFDKANRSTITGMRGPGLEKSLEWFSKIKEK